MTQTSRRPRLRVLAAATPALVLTLMVGSAGVEGAVAAPADSQTHSEDVPTTPGSYKVPTAEELAAQQAEAARLASQVADQQKAIAEAQAALAVLQAQLEQALELEAEATDAENAARAEMEAQNLRLEAATALVQNRRDDAGRWASSTYRNGQYGGVERMMSLLGSRNTDDMAQRMQMLDLVGRWRGSVVDTVEEARAVQADATTRSQEAAAAATKAHTDAEAARATAEASLQQQTSQMMLLNALLVQTQTQSAQASADAQAMQEALAAAMAAATAASAGSNNIVGAVDPNCVGGDISGYANGQIPTNLLCPLYAAPGHVLRADAAKAFNDMSVAYAAQFGAPICVTDSYRTLASQISVKARKPGLAAKPGTSRHGLAVAVDLCGGIQSFNTPQHNWMRANAPQFGWCDPVWARQTGSKPEAWHWQYMDCVH
ncbi:MAG: D-alanyl-D-alanine carboxypeptidase family protein [Actinomycetales bacterium]